MTEKDEKSSEQLVKESKSLERVQMALDVQEAGPWRSSEEVETYVKDYCELLEQGFDFDGARDISNLRESIRLSAKVDSVRVEKAWQHCVSRKVGLYGCSEQEANHRCEIEFKLCKDRFGEKPYEARTLRQLDDLHAELRSEIVRARYDAMNPRTPEEAELLARRKLNLPRIITLTKSEEPEKEKRNRATLDHMPNLYLKSKDEIQKEAQKERREHGG